MLLSNKRIFLFQKIVFKLLDQNTKQILTEKYVLNS